ncbi:hypothetical protein [Myxococcus sp. CA039A]|uniref:hypothetical protein n=1 Tax=Myxococcus sp. CA039A TaxID=2741737 RepID=UPI00157A71BF|nr:hypothetical protein [Myxococcus sp. CA039A]NTX57659.1 hypothetical protein [Myxococcus sp. CA039A]
MKSLKLLLLACAASLAFGCGVLPAEAAHEGEEISASSGELAECFAVCGGSSVTCPEGTRICGHEDYVGVWCDDEFYECPPPTTPFCSYAACSTYHLKACTSADDSVPCCDHHRNEKECYCTGLRLKKWNCNLSFE